MKKAILFALLTLAAAATAYGAAQTMAYGTALPTGLNGKLSTNVQLAYKSSADNSGYTVGTYHTQGTKTYASSSGDATIWTSSTTAKDIPAAPVGTASADFSGGDWVSQ
ncbi:hypothetical protein [Geomesophilobacter sediminis]|uniref:Uncharacterized protein n=1 Tax=Geomesophilobacter sediminis TaxID=2798584 RepID=A0A8J7JAT6_9BACT|nr:hypothetical protein [Geomesophilobacter sediminis]MBJ6724086.1 hypothetical protein [Geomesophilobacter sediminis]